MAAGADDHDWDLSENKGEMRPPTAEEKRYLKAGGQGEGKSGNRAESADRNDGPATEESADDVKRDNDLAGETQQRMDWDQQEAELEDLRKTNTRLRTDLQEVNSTNTKLRADLQEGNKTNTKLRADLEGVKKREYESDARFSILEQGLRKDLSIVTTGKNQLSIENGKLEKELTENYGQIEQLRASEDQLMGRVQEVLGEKKQKEKEHKKDSSNNADLLKKLDAANEELGSSRGIIENLKAEVQKLDSKALKSNAFKAEAARLKAELMKARKENDVLKVQMDEYGTEICHHRPIQREDEASSTDETGYFSAVSSSLEDEMSVWESDSVDAGDQDQGMEHKPSQAADIATEAQGLGVEAPPEKTSKDGQNVHIHSAASEQRQQPETEADKVSTGGQGVISTSTGDEKPSDKSIHNSPPMQTGDATSSASDADDEAAEGDSEVSSDSTQPPETPEEREDSNRLKKHLARPIPSPSVRSAGSIRSIKLGLQGSPPTPRMDSTGADSDPSPLSLNGGHGRFDSVQGEDGPSQGRLPSVSEAGGVALSEDGPGQGRLSSVSEAGGVTLSEAGGVDELGSTRIPGTPRSDFRFGRVENAALDPTDNDGEDQTTSKESNDERDENKKADGDRKEDYNTQTRPTGGEQENGDGEERTERTAQYSSMAWLTLFLCLALLWWLSRDDKQLWMQANERTRNTVVGLRDERWVQPAWLARMSFDGENMLKIDRSMFA